MINGYLFISFRFLRSVSYRQFTRLVWDYTGSSNRYPLPCCAYNAIRAKFPSDEGKYKGFEEVDDEDEEQENSVVNNNIFAVFVRHMNRNFMLSSAI